ncbi:MAG: class I SAM-dependent methyltransferase [Chloroflexales bacterium]|nr:class I SAM-dependent methyltransferase [Chloroflexales bacterium]
MDIYRDYAAIYDAIGQGAFAEGLVALLLPTLTSPPRRALDLACGTGAGALTLARAGAQVVGVDRSPRMLAIAAARARDAGLPVRFLEADIRFLPIADGPGGSADAAISPLGLPPASFDLITCLYDSFNYLTGDGDLELALAGAARLLRPGGRLLFDLNTEHEFAAWDDGDQVVHDADGILVYNRLSYDHSTRLAYGRIVWFVRDHERWWRGEETHTERAWTDAEVLSALDAAGLALVARRGPRWETAPPGVPRVVYEVTLEAGRYFSLNDA